ncbi:hypothetical protein BGW38_004895 [Lunasporangiospora selenospora]|uniref:Uncharacterized protein n=1 Tax=Lunasporangiospora selenospora TaxID=979761 RepID=A0A9P6KBW0_9FUNG|nr:hypothetical protein BGW38_004895 [Lunasporangiospora selenospora]
MSSFERDSSDANNTSTGESDSDQREGETGAMTRTSQRQSALQIDTSATRPSSSGHNRLSRTSTRRRSVQSSHQDLRPESMLSSSTTVRNLNGDGIPSPAAIVEGNSDSGSNGEGNDSDDTDNNSIMEAIQQGTRAWARRASELSLGLNVGREPRDLEMEDGSDESALNSALDSARPPFGSQGSDHPFSPSLESNLSYGTSSTFSHSNTVFNTASTEVSFSQRSSSIQQWEQHSLALQMPTMDGGQTAFSDSESLFDQDILADNNPDQEEYSGRPWNEVSPEEDNKALDACHHRMSLRGEHPESASESQKSLSKDVITKLEEGIRNGSCATTTESSHIKDGASGSQSSVQENRSNSLRSSLQESDSSSSSSSSSSSNNHSVSALLQSSEQAWKSESPSGISPLLNELDIHYPIANVGLEESLTPTTRMAIGAEASRMHERSVSVSMSEDGDDRDQGDLRMVRENPSPVDSPIPTPSTARPRRRFPAGVSLINSESDDEADEVDEDIDEMDDGTDEQGGLREEEPTVGEIVQSVESPGSRVQSSRHSSSITRAAPMIQEEALSEPGQRGSMAADPEVNDDSADAQTPRNTTGQGAMPSMLAQDPLSATEIDVAQERHNTTEARGIEDHELDTSQLIIPLVRPQRTSLSSPPPLPLPLPVAVTRQGLYTSTAFTAGMEGVTVRDHQSGSMLTRTEPSNPEPRVSNSSYGLPHEVLAQQHEAFAVARHTLDVLRMRSEDVDGASDDGEEETRTGEQSRLEELVQYRTLVRYQPKLPKAHVMSDLISQIRVDCPQKEYGCQEIMELQQALQHGRDVCQHRMVMCPRARCGLWMRVDQILEHILLVDPTSFASNVPLSTLSRESGSGGLVGSAGHDSGMHRSSPSSVDTLSSRQGDNSTSRGPRFGHGPRGAGRPGIASPRSTGSAGVAINSSTNANTHHHHGGEAQSQTQAQQSLSSVNSGIPPCPGLTWEREQLARATGIIGQLTEENSSLRQMIRQLTAQNAKLMKDKDRWQRYANLGLGRDI